MLEVVSWQVSPDRQTVQFNVREVWSINAYNISKKSPQPASLNARMRFARPGDGAMAIATPTSVTWQFDPGLVVNSATWSRWGTNFIIVSNDTVQNGVNIDGRGLYMNDGYGNTTVSINGLTIFQVGLDYRGS